MREVRLLMVTGQNNNKFYNMRDDGSTIHIEYGRVDSNVTRTSKPSSHWDKIYKSKIKKGYKDVTHLMVEEEENAPEGSSMKDIADRVIDKLFKQLQAYANHTIQESYKVSSSKVTQAMVDEAQAKVDELANHIGKRKKIDVVVFNDLLLELFHIIPRRMKHVRDWLVDTSLTGTALREKCEKLVGKEQSTLDVMAGQVIVNTKTDEVDEVTPDVQRDILEVLGLEVRAAETDENKKILGLMGANKHQFRNAYKVINKKTQKIYDDHMGSHDGDKSTELFWHGSRNENWLNILTTGLLIRPSGAVYSGSMFGDGIYFADKAQKSIGYTSLRGSYWARGDHATAFLALFEVHVGKQHQLEHSDSSLSYKKVSSLGCDSTFARAGRSLRNNEYIVYRSQQCTISYLVEIGG